MTGTLTRLPVPAASRGEGPCWNAAEATLYWIDVPVGRVHALDAAGQHRTWEVGQPVGAVALRASGGLVLAAADGFYTLDTGTGAVAPLVGVDHGRPGVRMNDGSCDRAGRFYAGSMAADESPGQGPLRDGVVVGETTGEQTRITLENLAAVLAAAGAGPDDVVRCGVFLADMADFAEMNSAYGEFFADPLPARTTVGAGLAGFKVEIDCVAVLPAEDR